VLLLLVGLCTAVILVTGTYTRYVKPSLMPWLVSAAVLLIALALSAIIRDIRANGRRGTDDDHHGSGDDGNDDGGNKDGGNKDGADHPHRTTVTWLLVLPIALLGFVVPPALSGRAVAPTVTEVSQEVLNRPFPPLPAGRAPEVALQEVVSRAAHDSADTLDDRLITVVGFTLKETDGIDLGRVVISCCAADGRLTRLHIRGPAVAEAERYPEETWLRVEGTVLPEPQDPSGLAIPTLTVTTLTRIDEPENPYGY